VCVTQKKHTQLALGAPRRVTISRATHTHPVFPRPGGRARPLRPSSMTPVLLARPWCEVHPRRAVAMKANATSPWHARNRRHTHTHTDNHRSQARTARARAKKMHTPHPTHLSSRGMSWSVLPISMSMLSPCGCRDDLGPDGRESAAGCGASRGRFRGMVPAN
jgi:hypothetical protein